MAAITKLWQATSWAFLRVFTANNSWIGHSNNDSQQEDMAPQPRWLSAQVCAAHGSNHTFPNHAGV